MRDENGDEAADERDQAMTGRDEDALWRSIIENYGDRVDLDAHGEPGVDAPAPEPPEPVVAPRDEPDVLDAYDDPDDHFVPPPPPPLPTLEPPRLLAWAGVFGVPILVLLLTLVKIAVPVFLSLLFLAWFVGGFGYLVATMRREGGPDDWDDGAVL